MLGMHVWPHLVEVNSALELYCSSVVQHVHHQGLSAMTINSVAIAISRMIMNEDRQTLAYTKNRL